MSDNVREVLICLILAITMVLIVLLSSCASPRYDKQGNGRWPIDRLDRWSIQKINGQKP